jgi:hypothetical protein
MLPSAPHGAAHALNDKKTYNCGIFLFLFSSLLVISFVPSTVFYFGYGTSFSLGLSFVCVYIILIYLAMIPRWQEAGKALASSIWVPSFVFVHFIFTLAFLATDNLRAFSSLGLLLLMVFSARLLANFLERLQKAQIGKAVLGLLVLMIGVAVMAVVSPGPLGENATQKPVFPFAEPSHFALSFIPIVIYVCVTGKKYLSYGVFAISVVIALVLQNLTLVAGCLLTALIIFRMRSLAVIAFLCGLTFSFASLDYSYYFERISFSSSSENLSVLVFLQGWQLIGEAIYQTFGWGIGFQQLGISPTQVSSATRIFELVHRDSNLTDGGFVLSKLVSEFGVFGVLLSLVFIRCSIASFFELKALMAGRVECDPAVMVAHSVLLGYLVELFVRGMGYFTSTGLFLMAALYVLWDRYKNIRC